jgi:anti-sigma regulatory factor (Ser/Thr protein kinase)
MREKVGDCLELGGVKGPTAYVLVTVVDELVCNILEHGGASWVELEMTPSEGVLKLQLRDDGREFDPVALIRQKGPDSALKNESERNLGLYMVSQLADSCRYSRISENVNQFSFAVSLK